MTSVNMPKSGLNIEQAKRSIERLIWPDDTTFDHDSEYFFVFRPFPKGLSLQKRQEWVELQVRNNSPFKQCDHYLYVSHSGAHIWYSKTPVQGIPETAGIAACADGEILLRIHGHGYRTVWKNGVMTECTHAFGSDSSTDFKQARVGLQEAWAVRHKLDSAIRKPVIWTSLAGVFFVSALLWALFGQLTIWAQASSAEARRAALENEVGELLNKQALMRQHDQKIQQLAQWKRTHGYFPDAFGLIASGLNQFGTWKANRITWQDKTLVVEVQKPNLDITALITDLERTEGIQSIAIRPHADADTWVLEAVFI